MIRAGKHSGLEYRRTRPRAADGKEHRRLLMWDRCRKDKGFTLVELLVVIGIIALLAAILLPVLAQATHAARAARCRSRQRQIFQGARMYLNNFDEFFPLAWHEGTGATVETVTYARFAIQMATDTNVQFREASESSDKEVELFENNVQFWADPAKGKTNYYFSPIAVFKLPDDMTEPYNRHTQYTELTAQVPSTAMPMLSAVYAAIPDDEAEETSSETYTGITGGFKSGFVTGGSIHDAFYGVAQTYSGGWNETSDTGTGEERFDYRHNGAINVIFLDGHVDSVKHSHGDRIVKLHDHWNVRTTNAP
jgi:prepilin-type N-terminal cleavage/methylation domain-containing protein/prepilin-type processing-associated H-X9-DG protein